MTDRTFPDLIAAVRPAAGSDCVAWSCANRSRHAWHGMVSCCMDTRCTDAPCIDAGLVPGPGPDPLTDAMTVPGLRRP